MKGVKLLIENGASLDFKSFDGSAALHSAVNLKRKAMVKILIENGADVNIKCNNFLTPLHDAAKMDHSSEIVNVLLQNGASMKAKDVNKFTPIEMALMENRINAFKTMNYFSHLSP